VARDSVCGLVVSHRSEPDFGPVAASWAEVADDDALESAEAKSGTTGPSEIEAVERRATLFRLVDTLPVEQRRVVVTAVCGTEKYQEVAQEIRKTEGAVKQLQFRALSGLRARMEGADA